MTKGKCYRTLVILSLLIVFSIVLLAIKASNWIVKGYLVFFYIAGGIGIVSLIFSFLYVKKNPLNISKEEKEELLHNQEEDKINVSKNDLSKRGMFLDWINFICLTLMIILSIFIFFLQPSQVQQSSMNPTLKNGDRVIVYHFNYNPKRNDVVTVFLNNEKYGKYLDLEEYLVKRLVALPGDELGFTKISGLDKYYLLINGKSVYQGDNEDVKNVHCTVSESEKAFLLSLTTNENKIPEGKYMIIGDNYNNSKDSRYFGFIDEEDFLGKVFFSIVPFGKVE